MRHYLRDFFLNAALKRRHLKRGLLIKLLLMLWWSTPTYATLHLELTRGMAGGIPVVILPFKNGNLLTPSISQVIRDDLRFSGYFRVLSEAGAPEDLPYWQQRKVEDIVSGEIVPEKNSQYQVKAKLVSLFQEGEAHVKTLLTHQSSLSAEKARALGHYLSDAIFEKLTGYRGVFSTKIAYVVVERHFGKKPNYRIEISDMDGANAKTILKSTQPLMSPTWSPDGHYLVYVSFEDFRSGIYWQNIQTGARQKIVAFKGINGAPSFSPDGTRLALVLSKTGVPKLYIFNLKTRDLTQMTDGLSIDTEPSWAPDGKSLLFTSNRGGSPQIYRVHLLSHEINRVSFEGSYNARASFTPDGKSIVMLHGEGGGFYIAVQEIESGRLRLLAKEVSTSKSPSVAPNGQFVLFSGKENGQNVLEIASIDGNVRVRLPALSASVQEPVWSPFIAISRS